MVGQVSGVAKGQDHTVWVLHRGHRVWDSKSFKDAGRSEDVSYTEPIHQPTILQLDQDTGRVLNSFGADLLYMPHMITPDWDGNLWVTDVGLHQAIKLSPAGEQLMAIGQRLQPGHDTEHLCKPTHVSTCNCCI